MDWAFGCFGLAFVGFGGWCLWANYGPRGNAKRIVAVGVVLLLLTGILYVLPKS